MNPSRPSFICAKCARTLQHAVKPQSTRSITTSSSRNASTPSSTLDHTLPRWKQPPPAMKMPIRLRPQPKQPVWKVYDGTQDNDEALNAAYDRFFGSVAGPGKKGRDLLDEETKYLALTHKSHSHGRLGFNDRLAWLGKRIVDLQTSLALLSAPSPPLKLPERHVYRHPALSGIDNIAPQTKAQILDKTRLAQLASSYGLAGVVRWKPRKSDNLQSSGVDAVLAQAVYAVVGATALKLGGEVAAKMARERVLQPLGLR